MCKGGSRLCLGARELEQVIDQFIRMNALDDLSTEEVDQLRWLAFGLFHSPKGLSTAAWVNVNRAASKRNLGFFMQMIERESGFEDPGMQGAAAHWMLSQRRLDSVREAVDPFEAFAAHI